MDRVIGPGNQLSKDVASGAAIGIGFDHARVHSGDSYVLTHSAEIDIDEVISISFKTPDTDPETEIHSFAVFDVSGETLFEQLEEPTITVDTGSQIDAINRNRAHIKTSQVESIQTTPQVGKATTDATITADGTVLRSFTVGQGRLQSGAGRDELEFVLKPNAINTYRLTSKAAGVVAALTVLFYELEEVE